MIIYPNIELLDGKVVRLPGGDIDNPVAYDDDPVELAKSYAAAGAQWIQVIDLDAVQQGGRFNHEIILKIIEAVNIPVQVGGGMRTMATIGWWIERAATRVILGTVAVKDRRLLQKACARYPGRIVVSIDAKDGNAAVEGWKETTVYSALKLAKELQNSGVAEIIFTDIDYNPDLPDASFGETEEMARQLTVPVISSGLVRDLDALSTLKYLPNISGAIVGYALLNKSFTLDEAIALCI